MINIITIISLACSFSGSISKLIRVPAKGSILQVYRISLFLGSQQIQSPSIMLDTGSGLTIIPCANCINCNDKRFDIYNPTTSFSSSFPMCKDEEPICQNKCQDEKQQNCQFSSMYLQGSQLLGKIVNEDMYWIRNDKQTKFRSYLGCLYIENTVHGNKSTSIMGLSPKPNENILYSWFKDHPEDNYQFSTCMNFTQGFFQIGSSQEQRQADMVMKYNSSQHSYNVENVKDMMYGNINISEYSSHVVVDTGSSFCNFPQDVFKKMKKQIAKRCKQISECQIEHRFGKKYEHISWDVSDKNPNFDELFHPLTFKVNGVEHTWLASNYFMKVQAKNETQRNHYYITFGNTKPMNIIILGMVWMINKKVTFDLKLQTISVYNNYNCTFIPVHKDKMNSIEKIIGDWFVLIIVFFIVVFLIGITQRCDKIRNKFNHIRQVFRSKVLKKNQDVELQEESFKHSGAEIDSKGASENCEQPQDPSKN